MAKADKTKVALVQMHCGREPEKNFSRALDFIREASKKGAKIVCLPELFLSQYFCHTEDHKSFELAEEIPGKSISALAKLAGELGVAIVASLFEKRRAGVYHNTAAIIDADGKFLGKYRKMHIPDDPLYHEKFYFTPGDLGFQAWETAHGKIGVCVCWDQWDPEAARLTALRGAEIIFYPTAIGWHPTEKKEFGAAQHSAWETIQRGHAIANGCYVAVPNRVGHEAPDGGPGLEFWGQSFVSDPAGKLIAKGSLAEEEILLADLDLSSIDVQRSHWPFLRDRRVDAYAELTKRFID